MKKRDCFSHDLSHPANVCQFVPSLVALISEFQDAPDGAMVFQYLPVTISHSPSPSVRHGCILCSSLSTQVKRLPWTPQSPPRTVHLFACWLGRATSCGVPSRTSLQGLHIISRSDQTELRESGEHVSSRVSCSMVAETSRRWCPVFHECAHLCTLPEDSHCGLSMFCDYF